jgi:general secretion pathway protein G
MVVIVIIGLVTGITSVAVMDALRDARLKATQQSMIGLEEALKLYSVKHGRYPGTDLGLKVLVAEHLLDKSKMLADSWGNDFAYLGEKDHYTITSYGDDGQPGGEGAAADLVVEGGH